MEIRCITGRHGAVEAAFRAEMEREMRGEGGGVLVLVPAQYTLQAEMDLLSGMEGSFRLQVLSPARLHARIFAEAGSPPGVRIDRRGKVMLLRAALASGRDRLSWYRGSAARPGFADRAVAQIEAFKQAGLTPEELLERAEGMADGALKYKLSDLAWLYGEYEKRVAGRFLDGEDEARQAVARMGASRLLREARVWVYGFDMVSPVLAETLLAMARHCRGVTLALTLITDPAARDISLFRPVARSFERLRRMAREAGVSVAHEKLEDDDAPGELRALERETYCYPVRPYAETPRRIQAASLRNPQDEAEFAACLARHLVMKRGWRWRDVAVACRTLDAEYADALRRAFAMYEAPLFLSQGRPADRHPFARFFLAAVRMACAGVNNDDMLAYMRSGFAGVSDDGQDALANYALEHGMRQKAWTRPLRYGEDAEALEPVRAALVEPVMRLGEALRQNPRTRDRLTAIFAFLEESGAFDRLTARQDETIALGRREWAAEGAQVWNRVVAAMDQMCELMGEDTLPLSVLAEMFEQALAAEEVKELPQSPDAVSAGEAGHMKGAKVKALLLLGMSDAYAPDAGALLDDRETRALSEETERWLGPDADDRAMMKRLGVKSLLALPEDYLFASFPQSASDGSALRPGMFMRQLREIFPRLTVRGGLALGDSMRRLRLNARAAAMARVPAMLAEEAQANISGADDSMVSARAALRAMDARDMLAPLRKAAEHVVSPEKLPASLVRAAYGDLRRVSVTRLEKFAACPYAHFARYALRPRPFREYSLTADEEGVLYHSGVEKFVKEAGGDIAVMDAAQAARRMEEVSSALVEKAKNEGRLSGPVAAAQEKKLKRVLRRAANTLVEQMEGSAFRPCALEVDIRPEGMAIDGESAFAGRIDRVDAWDAPGGKYVRVIDYKTGGKKAVLSDAYNGVRMQLIVYLQAARAQMDARAAGAFYFGVDDPIVKTDERDADKVEAQRRKELRMDGFLMSDADVYKAMAADPSRAVTARVLKSGQPAKDGKLLTEREMEALIRRVAHMAREFLRAIKEGDISVLPARSGTLLACRLCDYRVVCQFDENLPGAKARPIPRMKPEAVLDALRGES